jgi:DNA-binding MarR family transcriptional regulator
MPVDTFEQRATARHARQAAPAASAEPTLEDVNELVVSLREMFMQAKNRQRAHEQTSDHGRVSVLFVLSKLGAMRASALAKEIMLDLSTVSRHLRALEDEGYVAKTADAEDKRAFLVELTQRGHDFVQEFWRNRVAAIHTALTGATPSGTMWSADDVRALTTLLDRFVRDTEGCI